MCDVANMLTKLTVKDVPILKKVAWYNFWMFFNSVDESKNNYFQFNENPTWTANRASEARVLLKSSLIKQHILQKLRHIVP